MGIEAKRGAVGRGVVVREKPLTGCTHGVRINGKPCLEGATSFGSISRQGIAPGLFRVYDRISYKVDIYLL